MSRILTVVGPGAASTPELEASHGEIHVTSTLPVATAATPATYG